MAWDDSQTLKNNTPFRSIAKSLGWGGGLFGPHFQPPPPLQGSKVRQPERVWEGLGTGVRGYPTYIPQNDPHDSLIILRYVLGEKNF